MKTNASRISTRLAAAGLALLALGAGGCTSSGMVKVQPWERATMTSYPMRADRDPTASAMLDHMYFSREAASGGKGVGGSGCGCN